MQHTLRYFSLILLLCISIGSMHGALAWDSVGHRVSSAVAMHYMSPASKSEALRILQQHPRYQQDFLEQMPASVARGSESARQNWLLGQAAFWPDIARGLPEADREKYNRANWHYIDGAWLRGQADTQGNTYLGLAPLPDIAGRFGFDAASADNIMNALDHNAAVLADQQAPLGQRAVALCWVLHLVGDIHQPLHVGSLYSATRFASGDRGGNGILTDDGNLHARWDRALRSAGIVASLDSVLTQHSTTLEEMSGQEANDWSLWMKESRALLLNTVYTEQMKTEILRTDSNDARLRAFELSANYVESMKYHAGMRLALAGRRLALWFDDNL